MTDAPDDQTMLVFGVSEFTTMPWSFETDVEHYAALGVNAFELCEQKLDDQRYATQASMVAAHGMSVSGVQPICRTFFPSRMMPDPKPMHERTARFRLTIERLARFAPGAPFICNTGPHPKGDMAEAMTAVSRELKVLAPIAADHGVKIALEPLNPTSVNVESAIWTVEQALDVIEAAGRDEIGLCLDYWNIWQNVDLETQIHRAGDRIFTVQASDWRTPKSFADRIIPGEGTIPLARLLRTTREAGYRGAYTVEIFSQDVPDSLYDGDMDAVIRRSQAGMTAAWAQSFT